jgi:beta-barrel assembly-enhancing protease
MHHEGHDTSVCRSDPLGRRTITICLWAASLAGLGACGGVSEDQEVEIGRQNSAQISAQLPLVQDPVLTRYLNDLGTDIADRTERSSLNWQFSIVNSDQVNAFAVPGGFIYVNRGLIERTQSLDELAGVLGHEIAHVTLRHSVRQMEQGTKRNVVVALLCTLTSVCESGVGRVAVQAAGSAWFARHSRADEAAADSAAIDNVIRAGIDPEGIPVFFERLMQERRARPGVVEGWFSSHPLEEQRVVATRTLIDRVEESQLNGLRDDSPDYQAFKARLQSLPPAPPPPPMPPR